LGEAQAAVFDARPYQHRGEEPFGAIMAAVRALAPGQELIVRNTFEPRPLVAVLAAQGFQHEARELGPGDWEVVFRRAEPSASAEPELDNRGIGPVEASVRTLQTLRRTPADTPLRVWFDADPSGFVKELAARGYQATVAQEAGHGYLMRIVR
jgi:uncharacterized protein (DUF2249 family)